MYDCKARSSAVILPLRKYKSSERGRAGKQARGIVLVEKNTFDKERYPDGQRKYNNDISIGNCNNHEEKAAM